MVAKSPWKTHRYLKFDPSGLGQTYRDQTTGAELPVFAVFNLEGRRELRADIGMDRAPQPSLAPPGGWRLAQCSLRLASGLFLR